MRRQMSRCYWICPMWIHRSGFNTRRRGSRHFSLTPWRRGCESKRFYMQIGRTAVEFRRVLFRSVLLDMSDVDSQKWFQYSATRKPAFLFDAVAKRLRKQEILYADRKNGGGVQTCALPICATGYVRCGFTEVVSILGDEEAGISL